VPSTGFASASDLEAVRHVGDSAAVRATRARAGIGAAGSNGRAAAGAPAGRTGRVNLLIDAPNRIFLRGRGLDAELGGTMTLGGTLRALSPSGGLDFN
jgi:translocation and assembly module TamB